MTIHKKPVEEKEHDSEKYRFMKEQVRPQQKKNAIKYAQKAVSVIVLALISVSLVRQPEPHFILFKADLVRTWILGITW